VRSRNYKDRTGNRTDFSYKKNLSRHQIDIASFTQVTAQNFETCSTFGTKNERLYNHQVDVGINQNGPGENPVCHIYARQHSTPNFNPSGKPHLRSNILKHKMSVLRCGLQITLPPRSASADICIVRWPHSLMRDAWRMMESICKAKGVESQTQLIWSACETRCLQNREAIRFLKIQLLPRSVPLVCRATSGGLALLIEFRALLTLVIYSKMYLRLPARTVLVTRLPPKPSLTICCSMAMHLGRCISIERVNRRKWM